MASTTPVLSDLEPEKFEHLLDAGRYMTAFRLSAPFWGRRDHVPELDADRLLVAARLASNLGNGQWCRALMRLGRDRYPDHEGVALFSAFYAPDRAHPLDRLREFDVAEGAVRFSDPDLQASWLALAAMHWASVRDMSRAHRLLAAADLLPADQAFIVVTKAEVLLREDRWEAALEAAEHAWTLAPGRASIAGTLGRVLSRAGRVEEAATRLAESAKQLESYGVAAEAIHYLSCMAEQTDGEVRSSWIIQAQSLSGALPSLAPLADRHTRRLIEQIRFDLAHFSQDRETLAEIARDGAVPYLRSLASEILSNGGSRWTVLPIVPMRQKHNTCLPTAIGSLLGGREIGVDVDALVQEVSYGGTATWRAVAWLKERGMDAHPIIVNRAIARTLIEAGHAFIFVSSNLENAHAMTAFGLDYGANCLLVHDPSGLRWVRYSLDYFANAEAPLGPEGLLIGTRDEVARALALIPPENAEAARLMVEYGRRMEIEGATSADAVRAELEAKFPSHPIAYYVRALQLRNLGRDREALKLLRFLLDRYPRCERLQSALLSVLDSAGDTVGQRAALEEIVEGAKLPGMQLDQAWRRPPVNLVLQYAQLLGRSGDRMPKAHRLLRNAVALNPGHAQGYFGIGALLHRSREVEASLLPLQIAASLEPEDAHFARMVMHVLSGLGREEEGFAYLRDRAQRLSTASRGVAAWTELAGALETYGYPDRACAVLIESLETNPANEQLLAFAVQFWSDADEWDRAAQALDRLAEGNHRLLQLPAAAHFHLRRGDRARARKYAAAWLEDAPLSGDARYLNLNLVTMEKGQAAGVDLVAGWLTQQPDNENIEQLLVELYRRLEDDTALDALVERLLARDPDDAWAWRERAIRLIRHMEGMLPARRKPLEEPLRAALAACERICPEDTTTCFIRARLAAMEGRYGDAADHYLQAVRRAPGMLRHVDEIGGLLPRLGKAERMLLLEALETILLESPGRLAGAHELSVQFAIHLGFAEAWAALSRWGLNRGRDPRLVEAAAALLLDFGAGKPDAARARELLQDAVERFPAEQELRHLLARCLGTLESVEEEEAVCRELMRRAPADIRPRLRLAHLLGQRGQDEEALALLETCIELNPSSPLARDFHARFLWAHGRPVEAIRALEDALSLIPESIGLREQLIDYHAHMGNGEEALRVVDAGLARFPEGAYVWFLRALVLQRSLQHRDYRLIEAAYRKALEYNAALFDACDALAVLLCETRRFQDALNVLEAHRAMVPDETPLRGRIAWVRYEQGDEAGARADMRALLADEPRYDWGWRMLIAWLAAGKHRSEAKEVLPGIHEALPGDGNLRGFALDALTRLENSQDAWRADWEQLLADFPKDLPIHLLRFDLLFEWKEFTGARAVLAAAEKYHTASPYLRARDVQLSIAEGDTERALSSAKMVWLHPADDTEWPEGVVWSTLEGAGLADRAAAAIEIATGADYRVGRTTFTLLCAHLRKRHWDIWGRGRAWAHAQNPGLSALLPGKPARRLLALLELLDTVSWPADEHRAVVLYALNDAAHGRCVYRWYKKNKHRVNASPVLWQAVGAAVVDCWPRFKFWLHYFHTWRDKQGIQLRSAAFYVIALQNRQPSRVQRRKHIKRLHENANEALERLRHDETARYMACVAGASLLQLGRWDAFLECMDRYGAYVREPGQGDAFLNVSKMSLVPEILDGFQRLLHLPEPDTRAVTELSDGLARHFTRAACPDWAPVAWHQCIAERLPGVQFDRRLKWKLRRFIGM